MADLNSMCRTPPVVLGLKLAWWSPCFNSSSASEIPMAVHTMQHVLTLPVSDRDHIQGPANAKVTLVEYGDYQCPYCLQAYPIMLDIQQYMGDRMRLVFRNFPRTALHPDAQDAAEAAEAAGAQ